jgi:hydroxymethylpyrimidine pyrophosphatase-like HAD family hydrolase
VRVCYLDLDETLLGHAGGILRDGDGVFSHESIRALEALHAADVPVVLVSGRRYAELAAIARMLGCAGALGELGACDAGYPTREGQTVHEAIAETGIVDTLLAWAGGALEPYEPWAGGRQGSHLLVGVAEAETLELVGTLSRGTLRLVDNGAVDATRRAYHLLPSGAGKGPAVARDIVRRNADATACLAVGDSRADLELIEVVGLVALVRNGVEDDPELATQVPWVTSARHGAGVREAVERWLANDPELESIRRDVAHG